MYDDIYEEAARRAQQQQQKQKTKRRRKLSKDDEEWLKEQAMEAGMLHGIDAYNDMMGY